MQESKRTLLFVGTAVVTVALAAGTHWAMRPVSLDQFSDVGEQFYPEFTDPNEATGLRVAAYNEDAARVDVFNVEFKDGLWRIPSHHNYPADGEDRLSNTATSIIGITRDALVSTSDDDFKQLGVLDPLDESIAGTEGRGDRITLLDGEQVLADYIIGNKIEGQENLYNVRRPDENRTYRAALNLDISTQFADWIEPGLLDITRSDLREIVIDGYSIDETRGVLVPGEVSRLTRESSTGSWELNDLAEDQKVKTSEVNSVINGLEDLKIVGVRPKPPGLSADLKGEGTAQLDTLGFVDLQSKGYFVDRDGALVSNEGEVRVGTADGALYVLRFGEVFTGSEVEIEVGKSADQAANGNSDQAEADKSKADKSESDADKPAENESDTDDASEAESSSDAEGDAEADSESDKSGDDSQKQSRYLFITAQFDESLIEGPGEKPVKPEKPEPKTKAADEKQPASDKPKADATEAAADEKSPEDADAAQAEEATKADEAAPGSEKPDESADKPPEKSPEEAEYEKALAEYETQLKQWEADQKAYEEKLEKGRERVSELNARFADWYYVISADSFDEIRVARADLIETEEPKEPATPEANPAEPPAVAPELPPAGDSTDSGEPSESSDTPAANPDPSKSPETSKPETPKQETDAEATAAESEPVAPAPETETETETQTEPAEPSSGDGEAEQTSGDSGNSEPE